MLIKVIRDQSQAMRHIVHVHLIYADGSLEEGGAASQIDDRGESRNHDRVGVT